MTQVESLAKFDKFFRKRLEFLPYHFYISFYSNQKKKFLKKLSNDYTNFEIRDIKSKPVTLWDIEFKLRYLILLVCSNILKVIIQLLCKEQALG